MGWVFFLPFSQPTPHFFLKYITLNSFHISRGVRRVFPPANLSFWRSGGVIKKKPSLDVCWSLRWQTVRDVAPDNDSA